jgi:hypothetical protein
MHERRDRVGLRPGARLAAGLLAGAVLLGAACSSDDSAATADPTASTTTAAPTSTIPIPTSPVTVGTARTPWSAAEATQHYRDALTPVSQQLAALSAVAPDDVDGGRAALRAYGDASATAADVFSHGSWADALRTPVNGLIAALLDQADLFHHLAGLPDVTAMQAESGRSSQAIVTSRTAAAAVETALGIDDGLLGAAADTTTTAQP